MLQTLCFSLILVCSFYYSYYIVCCCIVRRSLLHISLLLFGCVFNVCSVTALRLLPTVTRLTAYRRLYICMYVVFCFVCWLVCLCVCLFFLFSLRVCVCMCMCVYVWCEALFLVENLQATQSTGLDTLPCTWLVETIISSIDNHTSNLFVRVCFRQILVEQKIRDMMTRFGS